VSVLPTRDPGRPRGHRFLGRCHRPSIARTVRDRHPALRPRTADSRRPLRSLLQKLRHFSVELRHRLVETLGIVLHANTGFLQIQRHKRVDAYHASVAIDQRSAGVSSADRGAVLDVLDIELLPDLADDSVRDAVPKIRVIEDTLDIFAELPRRLSLNGSFD